MELRTDFIEPDEKKKKGGGTLDGLLDKYINNVKKNPAMKLRLLQTATENGIDPMLVAPMLDLSEQEMAQLQQASQQQQQQQQNAYEQQERQLEDMENDTPQQTEPEEMTPDELLDFMDQIIGFTDEDMTLGELREFGENNRDILETAINVAF